jgi:hypothetical protein
MDNIKIEFIGSGLKTTIGELTEINKNYILSHQLECNRTIPIININSQLSYTDWKDFNTIGDYYGFVYGGNNLINISINNQLVENNIIEIREYPIFNNNKNYLMSIEHLHGDIFSTYEFSIDGFDINKLKIKLMDLNCLLWGELIIGVEYDGNNINLNKGITNVYAFEHLVFDNDMIVPIFKY